MSPLEVTIWDPAVIRAWWRACPWCGRPLAEDPTRYTLDRDQELVVFCPWCGAETPVPEEVADA